MLLIIFGYALGEFPGIEHTVVDGILIAKVFGFRRQSHTKDWEKCFQRVLLSLADQQLVTSLAITAATFSQWQKISLYTLDMAWTLVITSLVTHLATLRYCPEYLREHKLLSTGRIIAIWTVIAGFIALQYTRQAAFAAFDNNPSRLMAWRARPSCLLAQSPGFPPDWGYDVLWDIVIVLYTANLLDKLYSKSGELHTTSFIYRFLVCRLLCEEPANFNNFRLLYESRNKYISEYGRHFASSWKSWLRILSAIEAAYFAITASVFADIPWTLFILTYCIVKLVSTWLAPGSPFWDIGMDQGGFGFGQMTALILLLLPILTACDAIGDVLRKKKRLLFALHSRINANHISTEIETANNVTSARPQGPEASTPNHSSLTFDTFRPNTPFNIEDEFAKHNRAFRLSIYALAAWSISVFIFVAVITAVPWYNFAFQLASILPFASWFIWSALLEFGHILLIIVRLACRLLWIWHLSLRTIWRFKKGVKERPEDVSLLVL